MFPASTLHVDITMRPLEVATYTLAVLANLETLLGVCLTLVAMMTEKLLRQKSNIMIACLLFPDLVRLFILNLQVIEFYHPEFARVSDIVCLIVFRLGMVSCITMTMWLLMAMAVHRYLLCVKKMSQIDNSKTCLAISLLAFAPGVLLATIRSIKIMWDINSDDGNGNTSSVTQNITEKGMTSAVGNGTKDWILNSTGNILKNANIVHIEACINRDINMQAQTYGLSVKFLVAAVCWLFPMLVQSYFYKRIYQHLNEGQRRFQSSGQVATRLHRNSRAVLNTLLTTVVCHLSFYIPIGIIIGLNLSFEVELITRVVTVNATHIGTLCFLVLHGGYR